MGGKVLTHQFEATSSLADVQRFLESQTTTDGDDYSLMTSFPKHIFTGEDKSKTLQQLGTITNSLCLIQVITQVKKTFLFLYFVGLVPSAVLIQTKATS